MEVSFLRSLHRHEFHVKAEISVKHSDRDVEFFILQKELDSVCKNLYASKLLEGVSCEMMAMAISDALASLGYSPVSVDVSEDGENGAVFRKE